ncbi:hypothetical protein CYLTODRAFT_166096 [Cylindrobasidium torrendii FP15055 ss-10]|uniref:Uncharacterized protein n=1 Tax=Cylindrobasidium torrendii FP15055 ss-10 TaxID=1314674 RepID=A0A0D7BK21_9AGAR|nr:hypothetical protein CYLTODRAFT_166096 [Cylindrobasidium torrendii FP15055 ss-10]
MTVAPRRWRHGKFEIPACWTGLRMRCPYEYRTFTLTVPLAIVGNGRISIMLNYFRFKCSDCKNTLRILDCVSKAKRSTRVSSATSFRRAGIVRVGYRGHYR